MILELTSKILVGATFQLEKFKEDGTITYVGEPFNNTILDSALLELNSYSIYAMGAYINLGSSNVAVSESQTGLVARTYSTNAIFNSQAFLTFSHDPDYVGFKRTFQFNIGTCAGTHREIGVSRSNNANYLNRQLIKDAQGNPMDLVIAADEGVRISVEVRVGFENFKPYSQIYKLDLNGATAGTITFQKGASTKTITWANLTSENTLFGGYSIPTKNFINFIVDLNTLDTTTPVVQVIKDPADGKYLIMCNPENASDMGLSIASNTLTGGAGAPTLTQVQVFESQIVTGTFNHTNETTSQVTPINFQITPVCKRAGLWNDNHGFWGTYVEWLAGLRQINAWYFGAVGGNAASSGSTEETVYDSTNVKRTKRKIYWAPGALNTGTVTITQFVIGVGGGYYDPGTLFKITLNPGITIENIDEFEVTYNLFWGRKT